MSMPTPPAYVAQDSLSTEAAARLARAALDEAEREGYDVTVAVTDRQGEPLAVLRSHAAGVHCLPIAIDKAWTAANFRMSTAALVEITEAGMPAAAIRQLPRVAVLGGGLPIQRNGRVVGAIGVSGAPGGHLDEGCALAALEVFQRWAAGQ